VIEFDDVQDLVSPVVIAAFEGWNDAADAASGLVDHLIEEWTAEDIGAIIDRALADMDALGIRGKDATPYLLGRIVEITEGSSLTANIALVEHNARLGAAIARAYAAS